MKLQKFKNVDENILRIIYEKKLYNSYNILYNSLVNVLKNWKIKMLRINKQTCQISEYKFGFI